MGMRKRKMIDFHDSMASMAAADLAFTFNSMENARNEDFMQAVLDFCMESDAIDEVFVADGDADYKEFISSMLHRSKLMWLVN
jgi:hypothetical protein